MDKRLLHVVLPILTLWRYRRKIDIVNFIKYKMASGTRNKMFKIELKQIQSPFFIRGASSDVLMLRDFFLEDDYVKTVDNAKIIIDTGANIGAATVLFKNRYPKARVIALEPDEDNCRLFIKNTRYYSDVHLIRGGLHNSSGKKMYIINPDAGECGYRLKEKEDDASDGLDSYSINQLMQMFQIDQIDIVKIDIEGGEKLVFEDNTE